MCSSSGFFHARLTCDLFVQLGSTKKAQDINNSWQLRCCLCCCSGSRQRWSVGRYRGGRWACSRGLGEDSLQRGGRPAQRVRCAAASPPSRCCRSRHALEGRSRMLTVGGREGGAAVRPARAAAPRSASYSYTFDFLRSRLPPPCVPSSATHGSRPTFQTPLGPDAIRPSRWSNSP